MGDQKRMKGKRVLVTGSGTGIGKGVALEFAKEGAAVALHYSTSADGAKAAVEEIRKAGGKADAFHADFTEIDQVVALAEKAIDFLGGMDVLVNNAGVTTNIPFLDVNVEQWDKLFQINVRGMFFVTQAAIKPMLQQGSGVVINVTSVHAFRAMFQHSLYASTKAAIVGFTRTLAVELAPKGIRVNAIAPGMIVVENYYRNFPDFDKDAQAKENIPVGFAGEPADVGRIAVFLASDDARYIVGQTIIADGGQSASIPFGDHFRKGLDFTWGKSYISWL